MRLDADARVDAVVALGDLRKLVRSEHVAVITHGDSGHLLGATSATRRDLQGTFEQRVLGVVVQMVEGFRFGVMKALQGGKIKE
ncbi:hypothetical protein [Streptomyces sp. NPDC102437]|uniref:hypothetical protein n=1 Tax=Streptomyces sp. NPDC102437 TaxID=3366175 RepID=UPI0038239F7C